MCIMEVIGLPPISLYRDSSRKDAFFDKEGKPILFPNERGKSKVPGEKPIA